MEEVQNETVLAAKDLYNQHVVKGLAEPNPFKGVGIEYIQFAKYEPKLFHLLVMTVFMDIYPWHRALCATKVCQFSETGISSMLDDVCRSILQKMKAGEK